jgi:hypothetical protein
MNVRALFFIVHLKLARPIVLRKKKKGDLSKRLPGEQDFFCSVEQQLLPLETSLSVEQ